MNRSIFLLCLAVSSISFADNTATGGGSDQAQGSNQKAEASMTRGEMICLLKKIPGVADDLAEETAESVTRAVEVMNFDSRCFNRVSLLHFLSQIISESGAGKYMTQLGKQSKEKTGFGYLQVTGTANLKMAQACMNEVDPPSGKGVVVNPESTIGKRGMAYKSALASLCWWDQNMVQNDLHCKISTASTDDAAKKVHQIVNAGSIGRKVTGGITKIKERQNVFSNVKQGDRQCRQFPI